MSGTLSEVYPGISSEIDSGISPLIHSGVFEKSIKDLFGLFPQGFPSFPTRINSDILLLRNVSKDNFRMFCKNCLGNSTNFFRNASKTLKEIWMNILRNYLGKNSF